MLKLTYSFQLPGADMAKRFGYGSDISLDFTVKTADKWVFGVEANYMFGNNVKEEGLLSNLRSSNGEIINEYGEYANMMIVETGFYFGVNFGKMIYVLGPNPNSGFIVGIGGGYMCHKIRIEAEGNNVPALQGDYIKGYDRLTHGPTIKEFIGYQFLGKTRLMNFYAGIEFYQGFTKSLRQYNYDTRQVDKSLRNDFLYSFKIGWILPFYVGKPEKYYTY